MYYYIFSNLSKLYCTWLIVKPIYHPNLVLKLCTMVLHRYLHIGSLILNLWSKLSIIKYRCVVNSLCCLLIKLNWFIIFLGGEGGPTIVLATKNKFWSIRNSKNISSKNKTWQWCEFAVHSTMFSLPSLLFFRFSIVIIIYIIYVRKSTMWRREPIWWGERRNFATVMLMVFADNQDWRKK